MFTMEQLRDLIAEGHKELILTRDSNKIRYHIKDIVSETTGTSNYCKFTYYGLEDSTRRKFTGWLSESSTQWYTIEVPTESFKLLYLE